MTTQMPDAELALIGAVMADQTSLDEITITGSDFSEPVRGHVFDTAKRLHNDGKTVDLVTLPASLPDTHKQIVFDSLEWSPMSYNVSEWANIVEHDSVRRRVAQAGLDIAKLDPDLPASDLIDQAQAIVTGLADKTVKPAYQFVGDLIDDVLTQIDEEKTFVESPWVELNRAIGGFRPGAVYVVAARPGVGKTVVAAQIAVGLAEYGAVAFSSLEMSASELVQRFISERALVSVSRLKNNRLEDYDLEKIRNKREALLKLNIAIDDRTSISPADIRAFARGLSRKHDISGIVVDYLQLMSSSSKSERYAQVTEFSRQMKVLAKDFNVPVIVLSQLNRAVESRADGRPILADLRESGAIEQDADVVMLLRREGEQPHESMIIDIAKNRHGQTWEVELDWQGIYSRAVDK